MVNLNLSAKDVGTRLYRPAELAPTLASEDERARAASLEQRFCVPTIPKSFFHRDDGEIERVIEKMKAPPKSKPRGAISETGSL